LPLPAGVLFDSIHPQRRNRERLRQFADDHAARRAVIFTTARSDVIAARLQARQADPAGTAAAGKFVITPGHFARIAAYLEPPEADEEVWTIDTSGDDLAAHMGDFERWLGALMA
jgi:hypothetical protein